MDFLNAIVALLNFVIIPAAAYGAQLALGALGVTLIYGVLRFSNFAHGDTMAFGTAVVILFTWWFQSIGISLGPLPTALLALPFGIFFTALLVLATDRMVYRHYRKVRAKPVIVVIASMGVMFIMSGITRFLIGVEEIRFTDGAKFVIEANSFKQSTGLAEGLALRTTQLLTIVTAALVVAALFWFLNRTRTGKSMRAFSDNEDLALLSGINPDRVVAVTWIIVAALATTAVRAVDSAVISVCAMHAGDPGAMSVIPGKATLVGTVRTFNPEVQDMVERRLNELCGAVALGFGATAAVHYERIYPATINSSAESDFAASVAESLVGTEHVIRDLDPSMGSEDFAFMLQVKPGAYLRIGQGAENGVGSCYLHNTRYDFNDDILPLGAALHAGLVEQSMPLSV